MRSLLFSCLLLGSGLASAAVVERVAAVVNNEVIALSEVYELGGEYIEQEAKEAKTKELLLAVSRSWRCWSN